MSDRTYGAEEKAKLERLVQEGVTVLQEIEDLQEGLKDTVKAVDKLTASKKKKKTPIKSKKDYATESIKEMLYRKLNNKK